MGGAGADSLTMHLARTNHPRAPLSPLSVVFIIFTSAKVARDGLAKALISSRLFIVITVRSEVTAGFLLLYGTKQAKQIHEHDAASKVPTYRRDRQSRAHARERL